MIFTETSEPNSLITAFTKQDYAYCTEDISLFYQINGLAAPDILMDCSAFKKGLLGTANEGTTIH